MSQIRQFNLTLDGTAQQLSDALTLAVGESEPPFRELHLQADDGNSNPIFLGGEDVTAAVYAEFLPLPPTSVPGPAVVFGPYEVGPVQLSEIYAIGTDGEVLNIFGVLF